MRRFVWYLIWERDDDGENSFMRSGVVRLAVVGLAVIGVAGLIAWRVITG